MTFYFPSLSFTLDALLAGKINENLFSDTERYIISYVKRWHADHQTFVFKTSGSTGIPKAVELTRTQLAYSAQLTLQYLFPEARPTSVLLCINPEFIGGTQVITRALVAEADLYYIPATSNPLQSINQPIDLCSLVPMQLQTILNNTPEKLGLLKKVLVGGAHLPPHVQQALTLYEDTFYQTFGMTETASHIGIKEVDKEQFQLLGDTEITTNNEGKLSVKGTLTNHSWIKTNDIVAIDKRHFSWLGRADWVINSGGIKIHPEELEAEIQRMVPECECYITAVPDDILGEKIVLISQNPILEQLKSYKQELGYRLPKGEWIVDEWPLTPGGKIDRRALKKWAANHL